jgi:putative transposase
LLRREGFTDNHKRVYRIYRAEGLNHQAIIQLWGMDFVEDALFNGDRFRMLTVVDNYRKYVVVCWWAND